MRWVGFEEPFSCGSHSHLVFDRISDKSWECCFLSSTLSLHVWRWLCTIVVWDISLETSIVFQDRVVFCTHLCTHARTFLRVNKAGPLKQHDCYVWLQHGLLRCKCCVHHNTAEKRRQHHSTLKFKYEGVIIYLTGIWQTDRHSRIEGCCGSDQLVPFYPYQKYKRENCTTLCVAMFSTLSLLHIWLGTSLVAWYRRLHSGSKRRSHMSSGHRKCRDQGGSQNISH